MSAESPTITFQASEGRVILTFYGDRSFEVTLTAPGACKMADKLLTIADVAFEQEKAGSEVEGEFESWMVDYCGSVGTKKANELRVLYLCGPEPLNDLNEMISHRMDRSGEGLTKAGRITGIIGILLSFLVFGAGCCFSLFGMMSGRGGRL